MREHIPTEILWNCSAMQIKLDPRLKEHVIPERRPVVWIAFGESFYKSPVMEIGSVLFFSIVHCWLASEIRGRRLYHACENSTNWSQLGQRQIPEARHGSGMFSANVHSQLGRLSLFLSDLFLSHSMNDNHWHAFGELKYQNAMETGSSLPVLSWEQGAPRNPPEGLPMPQLLHHRGVVPLGYTYVGLVLYYTAQRPRKVSNLNSEPRDTLTTTGDLFRCAPQSISEWDSTWSSLGTLALRRSSKPRVRSTSVPTVLHPNILHKLYFYEQQGGRSSTGNAWPLHGSVRVWSKKTTRIRTTYNPS